MEPKIELLTILKELHNISGFRISIYDTNLNEMEAYPKELSRFCSLLQQKNEVKSCCIKNDAAAFEIVKKTEDIYIYQCQFGLYEAVAPLYHFGVLSGYLMMGQTLDTNMRSHSDVFEKSNRYVSDKETLKNAISTIPSSSKEKIYSCITIMNICAEYISLSNRFHITDKNLAQNIKKYIHRNFSTKITMDSLSNHFFYSKPTIMSVFKETYHISISQYLSEVRLKHGAHLLTHSTSSIHSISKECGFSDQNYFSKAFFKKYGVTPSDFRKNSLSLP